MAQPADDLDHRQDMLLRWIMTSTLALFCAKMCEPVSKDLYCQVVSNGMNLVVQLVPSYCPSAFYAIIYIYTHKNYNGEL